MFTEARTQALTALVENLPTQGYQMQQEHRKCTPTHVSQVKVGYVVIASDDRERTVGRDDLKYGFCGITLFGDSYRMGTQPVVVVDYSGVKA